MRNVKKSIIISVLVCVIMMTGGIFSTPQTVMASTKSKAIKAYKEFLTENEWSLGGEAGMTHGKYFGLKDLNDDGVPELIINQSSNKNGKRCYAIFSYSKKYKGVSEVLTSWVLNECYFDKLKKRIVDFQGPNYVCIYKVDKNGNYKDIAYIFLDQEEHKGIINDKIVSYNEAEKKMKYYKKNTTLLETPYKITKKNIKKYVNLL